MLSDCLDTAVSISVPPACGRLKQSGTTHNVVDANDNKIFTWYQVLIASMPAATTPGMSTGIDENGAGTL